MVQIDFIVFGCNLPIWWSAVKPNGSASHMTKRKGKKTQKTRIKGTAKMKRKIHKISAIVMPTACTSTRISMILV